MQRLEIDWHWQCIDRLRTIAAWCIGAWLACIRITCLPYHLAESAVGCVGSWLSSGCLSDDL